MNTIRTRESVFLISGIMAVVASALFFAVPITPTFLIAYMFTILAIGMFCWGSLQLLDETKSYPWFAAFPMRIWQYLLSQLALSVVFVLRENLAYGSFSVGLFFFLHIALLGFFAVSLILMRAGQEIIEERGAEVKHKVSTWRLMQADVESIMRENPEHEIPLRRVLDALKYSDPMSNPTLSIYDEQIQRGILSMTGLDGNEPAKIPEICETLLRQIADRNTRVKIMK